MWDFKNKPELPNSLMQIYYWESPHPQIFEDFEAEVIEVHDGDTITLKTNFRDFTFPLRIKNINAPELSEDGGEESRDWLKQILLNEKIRVLVDPKNRVGKWGRLIGDVEINGTLISEIAVMNGWATPFDDRNEGQIPDLDKMIGVQAWQD